MRKDSGSAYCEPIKLEVSAFDGRWFYFSNDLREEDVIKVTQLAHGLLNPGESIVSLDIPELEGGLRWSVKDHGYFVGIGDPGSACKDVYPFKFDCASRPHCAWVIDLRSRRSCDLY